MKWTTMDEDLRIHQKLDDEPNDVGGLSAQELKEKFDQAGLAIQKYLNETHLPEEETAVAEALEEAKAYTDERVVAVSSGDMETSVYDTKKRCMDVYDYADAKANEAKADTSRLGYICYGTSIQDFYNSEGTLSRPSNLLDLRGIWPAGSNQIIAPAGAKAVMVTLHVGWTAKVNGGCYLELKVNGVTKQTFTGPSFRSNNSVLLEASPMMMTTVEPGDTVTVYLRASKGTGAAGETGSSIYIRAVRVEFIM